MKKNILIIRSSMLPNFITICNGICGFSAIYHILKIQILISPEGIASFAPGSLVSFAQACWFVLLGMVFDVFDGWAARASGQSSEIGAQLDSLCDAVSFGLAPALLTLKLNLIHSKVWLNMTWAFCMIYFLAAILRLARFNAEQQSEDSDDDHSSFKGLPTPAAAGCVVTLTLLYCYIMRFEQPELILMALGEKETLQGFASIIPFFLPFLTGCLGFTMIYSKLKFDHMGHFLLNREFSIESLGTILIVAVIVIALPEVTLPIIFMGYMLVAPIKQSFRGIKKVVVKKV